VRSKNAVPINWNKEIASYYVINAKQDCLIP